LKRREILKLAGKAFLGSAVQRGNLLAFAGGQGCVVGQPQAARAGAEVLEAHGNAVDAVVAAALVAGVVGVSSCGIGGYGGHMVIALPKGKKVTSIDFNSAAPAAARENMFSLDEHGGVKGQANRYGWLAAGVPGTLAGIQLAVDRYGTRPFRELVRPAIRFAREGFEVSASFGRGTRGARAEFQKDPGSARLLLDNGEPLDPGSTFRNPDLAAMLETLAERNSVDSFYRGDIGERIAAAFQQHGGLVTSADLAAYRAREVEPLELKWRGYSIRTAPLTAGGATVLEALSILKALGWEKRRTSGTEAAQARLESLRIAWADRLNLLGDPEKTEVPIKRLLSEQHAREMAARIDTALREAKALQLETDRRRAGGTIHLSAIDAQGTMVALTLTHGENFGARVTVDGLGLILGHGMSRFDPRPGMPNSPGPGKRPLHNMCPTVVLKDGQPILAIGGTGGRRIPNAIFEVLAQYVGRGSTIRDAMATPRMHTEGGLDVAVETHYPEADIAYLRKVGYSVTKQSNAIVHAVSLDPKTRACETASR
jgi:gamma-glutamyltranspeptidase/glutathione hydrolase